MLALVTELVASLLHWERVLERSRTVILLNFLALVAVEALLSAQIRRTFSPVIAGVGLVWIVCTVATAWFRWGPGLDLLIGASAAGLPPAQWAMRLAQSFVILEILTVELFFLVPVYTAWNWFFVGALAIPGAVMAGNLAGSSFFNYHHIKRFFVTVMLIGLGTMVFLAMSRSTALPHKIVQVSNGFTAASTAPSSMQSTRRAGYDRLVSIPAGTEWVPAGIHAQRGATVRLSASGLVQWDANQDSSLDQVDPGGAQHAPAEWLADPEEFLMPDMPAGGLVASVVAQDGTEQRFFVGRGGIVRIRNAGSLYFSVNGRSGRFGGYAGGYTVRIRQAPPTARVTLRSAMLPASNSGVR